MSLGACAYLQHPKFGAYPEGERLEKIQRSPHHVDGEFRNLIDTPRFSDGNRMFSIFAGDLFKRFENLRPALPVPTVKTDLKALDTRQDTIVWLGHSSYFVVFAGKRILIDPVFSPFAAPVSFSTKAFDGTSLYTAADEMPEIDILLIHDPATDHWATVTALEAERSARCLRRSASVPI